MRCPACDELNDPAARFCTSCGRALVAGVQPAQVGYAAPSAAAPPPSYTWPAYGGAVAQTNGVAAGMPPFAYGATPYVVNNVTNNVTVMQSPSPAVVVVQADADGPPLVLRALYFLCVGLWLGAVWIVLSWLLIVSVLGLPVGLWMINRLPQIMTLKPPRTRTTVTVSNGVVVVSRAPLQQRSLVTRGVYFLLVGWWASLVWLVIAYAIIAATLGLGLPISFWMVNRVATIATLAR